MSARLHPLHLRRLVGRTLADAERDLVKLLSALPTEDALRRLDDPAPACGEDFLAVLRAKLAAEQTRPAKSYLLTIPADLWDRYAERAREQHRTIEGSLVDALQRDDQRLREGAQAVVDARAQFVSDVGGLRQELRRHHDALAVASAAGAPDKLAAVRDLVLEERQDQRRFGVALASVLKVLHGRGWVDKQLEAFLRREGWLT